MSSPYQAYGSPTNGYMYPPNGAPAFNSSSTVAFDSGKREHDGPDRISRTPSPTPSEAASLGRTSIIDYKSLLNWRFWLRREWLWYYVIIIALAVITGLITIFHTQIIHWLTPAANWMKDLPAGWVIPIAIFFVISFPPLFGHEILAILCGVVWGLWIGFAIVAAGTFIGELGNFYAFKYCCKSRGEKAERTNITYACLAHVVREGGFKIATIARFSVIPGHLTTAVFSTCGMSVWTFIVAAFITLPKQFVTVYLGVLIDGSVNGETTGQRIASYAVITLTTIITVVAMWYITREMNRAKHAVIYARRKARQAKMDLSAPSYSLGGNSTSVVPFNARTSDSDIPLRPYDGDLEGGPVHQQWDSQGRAVGYTSDPRLHAPQPRPPSFQAKLNPNLASMSPKIPETPTAPRIPPPPSSSTPTAAVSDEWANALTPKTARAPDPAPISGIPYADASFPPAPTSPRRRPRSPPQSPGAQYASFPVPQLGAEQTGYPAGAGLPTPPFVGSQQQQQQQYGSPSPAGLYATGQPPPSYR